MSLSVPDETPPFPVPAPRAVLAQAAHELRTPLMAMSTAAELLIEDLDQLDPDAVRHMVGTLHRSAVWLRQLVENLYSFAALGREPDGQAGVPVDLCAVLHDAERVMSPLLAAKGQRLSVRAPATPPVCGTPQQLGQVCLNLLANASKFAPAGTLIQVVVSPTEAGVRVAVEDRGPGIPADAAARLFEPFYQAATPTAPAQRGVGLGLAIVREIVTAQDGRVGAENRRGGGARVWFELRQRPEPIHPTAGGID